MLRLAFDFIITWRETRTRPNAYVCPLWKMFVCSNRNNYIQARTIIPEMV